MVDSPDRDSDHPRVCGEPRMACLDLRGGCRDLRFGCREMVGGISRPPRRMSRDRTSMSRSPFRMSRDGPGYLATSSEDVARSNEHVATSVSDLARWPGAYRDLLGGCRGTRGHPLWLIAAHLAGCFPRADLDRRSLPGCKIERTSHGLVVQGSFDVNRALGSAGSEGDRTTCGHGKS